MSDRALRILAAEFEHQHKEITEPLVYPHGGKRMSRKEIAALRLRGSILFDLAMIFARTSNKLEELS